MIYQSRCGKCRARKTFNQDPAHYIERPKCACGGKFYVDRYRQSGAEGKKAECRCGAFPWAIDNAPHRKGSFSHAMQSYCVYAQPSTDSGPHTH